LTDQEGSVALNSRRSSVESWDRNSDVASLSGHVTVSSPTHMPSGRTSSNSVQKSPGRDEYNKATQTVETAFVPCASCDAVQSSLRAVGDATSTMCRSLNLTSSLDKYRARVDNLTWLAGE
jgi:hypothetical protein